MAQAEPMQFKFEVDTTALTGSLVKVAEQLRGVVEPLERITDLAEKANTMISELLEISRHVSELKEVVREAEARGEDAGAQVMAAARQYAKESAA
jgi:Asp-tRNA(Asn)/Glu-tRNA(Gln) amidotransferase C subunit